MQLYNYLTEEFAESQLLNLIKKRSFQKGDYLYQPPEIPNKVYELINGVVKLGGFTHKGEDVCYDVIYNQEIFGNFSFPDLPFGEFAKAKTKLEVISYDVNIFKKFLASDPRITKIFNTTINSRRCRMEGRLINIYSLNPTERILNIFQEFDKNTFCSKGQKIWIPDVLTDKDIAQLTGLARQTVSKILKSMCYFEEDKSDCKKKDCLPKILKK